MKASELIARLADMITLHGDCNVLGWDDQHMTYQDFTSLYYTNENEYDERLWALDSYKENFKKIANNIVINF